MAENDNDNNNAIVFETINGRINGLFFPSTSRPSAKNCKVLCIHGFCCDSRIFRYLGRKLASHGIDTYAIDLFGHGKSNERRGDPDFDKTLKAIDEVISQIRDGTKYSPDKQDGAHENLYILAHSLGCTYAMWYETLYKKKISGLILLAPYVWLKDVKKRGEAVPRNTTFYSLLIRRILTPSTLISATKVVSHSILQTKEVATMINDPEIVSSYSYRYIVDVIGFKNTKVDKFSGIEIPILIMHGLKDTNVYPQISEKFYSLLNSRKKSLKFFECDHWFNHAIFFNQNDNRYTESDREPIIKAIESWVDETNSTDQ